MAVSEHQEEKQTRGWSWRRWIVLVLALLLFTLVMREVLFPFAGKEYVEFSHGSHTHYAPKNRNKNVPVSKFPMRLPGPGKHITPDGKVVPDKKP